MYMNIFLFLNLRVTDFPIYFAIVLIEYFQKHHILEGKKRNIFFDHRKENPAALVCFLSICKAADKKIPIDACQYVVYGKGTGQNTCE